MTTPTWDENTLFLVDGSGYIFRAYYGIRPLSNREGVPTNAVYGFTTMLIKLLRQHKPQHLAIAFDTKEKTFRHDIYADYKANRPPPPEDLVPQFALIQQLVDSFAIKKLVEPGYEADDLIGTAARLGKAQGRKVVIVTADKDMMQLVDDDIVLYDEMRASRAKTKGSALVDREAVIDKFGVPPELVIDALALAGDKSDNVPGVRGIGEKTAALLINEFGSVEQILENAHTIKQKGRREKLLADADIARVSKQLVTIDTHAKVPMDLAAFGYAGPDKDKLRAFFEDMDFRRLLEDPIVAGAEGRAPAAADLDVSPDTPDPITVDRDAYITVDTAEKLATLKAALAGATRIAFDTETSALDQVGADLVGMSFAWAEGAACYIPLGHGAAEGDLFAPPQLTINAVRDALLPVLTRADVTLIAQHGKYDVCVLERYGFDGLVVGGDPMLASYLLEPSDNSHGLDGMSKRFLGHEAIKFEDVCGKGKKQIAFGAVPIDVATRYAAEDADLTLRLANLLEPRLLDHDLDALYREMELPLEAVLGRMEMAGMRVDTTRLERMAEEFAADIEATERMAHAAAGEEFNLASPKQVAHILFEKLGLKVVKKTKSGPSTDSSVLEKLAADHELPSIILRHRLISKLQGTYVEALAGLVHPKTGRVHSTFNQTVAATGRLSSQNPNMQNIPIRTTEGRRIREAFIADEGNVLISLDYSQIELRLLAHVSEDENLIDAFVRGQDIHQRTASEIFGVPLEDVTREQRAAAKTINFGLLYGMGPHRLAQTLRVKRKEAKAYLDAYFARYSGIRRWTDQNVMRAYEDLEVRTMFGRRRGLKDLASRNRMLQQRAERIANNTPIQGTAADLIKRAMIVADAALAKDVPSARLILQVHDELIVEAPEADAERARDVVKAAMESAAELRVPLVVDGGIAKTWALAH